MKKLIVVCFLLIAGMATKVSAQALVARLTASRGHYMVPGAILIEGQNTVVIPDIGTIKFVKRGETFSNVVFLDSLGSTTSMNPTKGGTNGAPVQECKSKLPDACFSTANKNVGMCICIPKELSGGVPGGTGIATAAKIAIICGGGANH